MCVCVCLLCQDGVDALMLAIFEAVRGHDKTEEEVQSYISI